ncbi:MAG: hypothetical protein E5W78_27155, partial [Mesorhizobium sp.]
ELARRMLAIDPEARSSMWDDLQRGRPTEIDELQGAILRLADREGTPAPLIKRVTALVRKAEQENHGSPGLTPRSVPAFDQRDLLPDLPRQVGGESLDVVDAIDDDIVV